MPSSLQVEWLDETFNKQDLINAIKRHKNPNWGGPGSGQTLDQLKIDRETYSWSELRRTPQSLLAVLAWRVGVEKADFVDAVIKTYGDKDGKFQVLDIRHKIIQE